MRKVQITWLDCVTDDGWEPSIPNQMKSHVCETLGHLIEDGQDSVTVAATFSDGDGKQETNSRVCIPRGCIVRIDDVSVGTKD